VSSLPTGTVTFLFSDVEGSTRLVQTAGGAYATVIADVRRLLRAEIEATGGCEVDATGDELSAVFGEVQPALQAAIAGQERIRDHAWPDGLTVRVRMGLHTGVPHLGEEGYTGLDVIRASRISAAGHGGQILLSSTAAPRATGGET
jgi:class 3 adenylate cyclase